MPVIGSPDIVDVHLSSRLNLLGVLECASRVLCERLEFDADTSDQVILAVVEAGTNAIIHGHGRDPGKIVDVRFESWPDRIEITVQDRGRGFDPAAVGTDIITEDRFLAQKGRGIFIMRACMDQVDFRIDANGTCCRLVKRRAASAAGAEPASGTEAPRPG
ncbi:MAG TPA: ATP-binding protein [Terriglobales bacterium]|nr:ATP-binding protein [Terriglobales bacterium]